MDIKQNNDFQTFITLPFQKPEILNENLQSQHLSKKIKILNLDLE